MHAWICVAERGLHVPGDSGRGPVSYRATSPTKSANNICFKNGAYGEDNIS